MIRDDSHLSSANVFRDVFLRREKMDISFNCGFIPAGRSDMTFPELSPGHAS